MKLTRAEPIGKHNAAYQYSTLEELNKHLRQKCNSLSPFPGTTAVLKSKPRREHLERISNNANREHASIDKAHLYRLPSKLLKKECRSIFDLYGGSVALAVMTEFPEFAWKVWRFDKTPHLWWQHLANLLRVGDIIGQAVCRMYLDELTLEYGLKCYEDWKKFRRETLKPRDVTRLDHFGGLDILIRMLEQNKGTVASIRCRYTFICLI